MTENYSEFRRSWAENTCGITVFEVPLHLCMPTMCGIACRGIVWSQFESMVLRVSISMSLGTVRHHRLPTHHDASTNSTILLQSATATTPSSETSVWRSGSVRFFSLFGSNRNRNRFIYFLKVRKTGSNCTQPVVCSSTWSKSRFWPTRPQPVMMWLESVRTDFQYINTWSTLQVHLLMARSRRRRPLKPSSSHQNLDRSKIIELVQKNTRKSGK